MINNRRLGGIKAQKIGNFFELFFQRHCFRQGITCIRIPDGCKQVGIKTLIRVSSPFDWFLGYGKQVLFLDTKTFDRDVFRYSDMNEKQIQNLNMMRKHSLAGYIIWFRKSNRIVFFDVLKLLKLSKGSSYNFEDGLYVGDSSKPDLKLLFYGME